MKYLLLGLTLLISMNSFAAILVECRKSVSDKDSSSPFFFRTSIMNAGDAVQANIVDSRNPHMQAIYNCHRATGYKLLAYSCYKEPYNRDELMFFHIYIKENRLFGKYENSENKEYNLEDLLCEIH